MKTSISFDIIVFFVGFSMLIFGWSLEMKILWIMGIIYLLVASINIVTEKERN